MDVKKIEERLANLEEAFGNHSHQKHEVDVVVVQAEEKKK